MPRVAAIDCGTNSIRLLVADVTLDDAGVPRLRDVHREMRIVRLGKGVDASGVIAADALARTRDALAEYTTTLRRAGAGPVRMVATSATRDAANREDFFGMVRDVLGTEAEVISGDTEARLSFAGAVADLDPADGPFVVVDVGGGSTEVVLGTWDGSRAEVHAARSVDVGCVRLTERCLHSNPPTSEELGTARRLARASLAEAFDVVAVAAAQTWVGVAGTVTTLAALAQRLPRYDAEAIHLSRLSREDVRRVTTGLASLPLARRAELGAMHPGRADVIVGGALIVDVIAGELAARAGITELVASEHDILDGIALSLA